MTASASPTRDPRIDTLRGLAIVLVVLHHLALRIPLKNGVLADVLPRWAISALLFNGQEAVMLFFVISGFLITFHSLTRWGSLTALDVRTFYVQRAARILPCLLVLLAVLSLLHLAGAKDYVISRADQSLAGALLSALGLHLNWYEGVTSWLPGNWDVLWSLSIEEAFYLAFPLLGIALRRERVLFALLLAFALALPWWHASTVGTPVWKEKAYLPGMACIAMGVVACLVAVRVRAESARQSWLMKVAGTVGLVSVLCFGDLLWRTIGAASLLVLTLSAALLLVAFHWTPGAQGHASTAWLRSFGRHSYEIYLTHMFLVWPVVDAWRAAGAPVRWGVLWYLPYVVAAWVLGWAVARWLSEPASRWIRARHAAATSRGVRGTDGLVATMPR